MEEKVTRQKKGFRRQAVRWSIVPNWENPPAGFLQNKKKKKKSKELGISSCLLNRYIAHAL